MYQVNGFGYLPFEQNKYQPIWPHSNAYYRTDNEHFPKEYLALDNDTSKDDDIGSLFKDKVRFQKLSTLQALYLIIEREALRDRNISSIDERIMYCNENLSRFRMLRIPMDSSRLEGLQKLLFDLEKQRRSEKVSSWQDTLKLKLDLVGMIKDYQSLRKQEALLEDVS